MMEREIYETPQVQVINMEVEQTLLQTSGTDASRGGGYSDGGIW